MADTITINFYIVCERRKSPLSVFYLGQLRAMPSGQERMRANHIEIKYYYRCNNMDDVSDKYDDLWEIM